jgi:subtilisin family serine protease
VEFIPELKRLITIQNSILYDPAMKSRLPLCRRIAIVTALAMAAPAHAQLGLPRLPSLPGSLGNIGIGELTRPIERLVDQTPLPDLGRLRLDRLAALVARHPDRLALDLAGNVIVRGEILAWSPSEAGLDAAAAAGIQVSRVQDYPELGARLVVLRLPDGAAALAPALDALRAADPEGVYDANHLFAGSGEQGAGAAAPATDSKPAVRVGLVDGGVDRSHAVFEGVQVNQWGCAGQARPAPHGTAVAALMVGRSGHFSGAAPGASLYAADVYCDEPTGGSVDRILGALGWLAREQVGVINISLVGPGNAALARAVQALSARGHLLVAAVGNDGPAAPPLYPASYPGVVGVSGVDRRGQPLPEAGRGPQVMFAAPGSQLVSAVPGSPPYRTVRGTSYAAPIVAGLLAVQLPRPDRSAAQRALATLASQAASGEAGRLSNATGHGVVGMSVRTDPARLR